MNKVNSDVRDEALAWEASLEKIINHPDNPYRQQDEIMIAEHDRMLDEGLIDH